MRGLLTRCPAARTGVSCSQCGLAVLGAHIERHTQVHGGTARLDEKSVCATWFCELCGLMFRCHSNLFKHWRGACKEIQKRIDLSQEVTMDDAQLLEQVEHMLKAKTDEYQRSGRRYSLVFSVHLQTATKR